MSVHVCVFELCLVFLPQTLPHYSLLLLASSNPLALRLCLTIPTASLFLVCESCLQASKTYLEKQLGTLPDASLDDLIQHALKALAASLTDGELTTRNCAVAVVGTGVPFYVLSDEAVGTYVQVRAESGLACAAAWAFVV